MTRYRQARLVLQLGRLQTAYTLVLRTVTGQDIFDRRLSTGVFPQRVEPDEPRDLIEVLERAVHDLRRRHGITADPAQRPGAPGGGGGVPTLPLAAVCKHECPGCGQHLDGRGLTR